MMTKIYLPTYHPETSVKQKRKLLIGIHLPEGSQLFLKQKRMYLTDIRLPVRSIHPLSQSQRVK